MIHFFIGTKAQLIKMAPLMIELQSRGVPYRYVDSGQHAEMTRKLRRVFRLPEPDVSLQDDVQSDVISIAAALKWYLRHLAACLFGRSRIRSRIFPGGGLCLVHGDTLSTLLGVQMARAAGLTVAHVESGLRSFRLWNPFPEELIRIWCMRKAQLLFAPSPQAVANLCTMRVAGRIIETEGNTVADSLRLIEGMATTAEIPKQPFFLATCHRLETISNRSRLTQVVELLNSAVTKGPVVFVRHKPTLRYLKKFGLIEKLRPEVMSCDMLDYCDFIALLKHARAVLTDGGSIQEECGYLRKPCLILRQATERSDGLGANAVLWKFDRATADAFLDTAVTHVGEEIESLPRPSRKIVEVLIEYQGAGV